MTQHYLTLTVSTDNATEAEHIFQDLVDEAKKFTHTGNNVSVSSNQADDSDELFFDEETLNKVRKVLFKMGLTGSDPDNAINDLQNAGILFRERAKD